MTKRKFPLTGTFFLRLGKCWDGECPVRVLSFRHSEQRSKAERDSESPALGWDFAPSLTWGRLGWGVSRKGFFSSLRLEAMRERKQTKPVRWRKTMSFPTARIIQIRHGVPFTGTIKNHSAPCNPSIYATLNRVQSDKRSVTPAHDTESPASREGFKLFRPSINHPTMRL